MGIRSRTVLAATLAVALAAAATPAEAFTSGNQNCRKAVAKGASKYAKTAMKAVVGCHKARAKEGALAGTDCNDIVQADFKGKASGAADKFIESLGSSKSKCAGRAPVDSLYGNCPAPCDAVVGAIGNFGDVAECMVCMVDAAVEGMGEELFGSPDSPLISADAKCQGGITKTAGKLLGAVIKDVTKCQAADEKAGGETTTNCTVTSFPSDAVTSASAKGQTGIAKACGSANFGSLDTCDNSQIAVAACVAGGAVDGGQDLAAVIVGFESEVGATTTTSSTTTTTLPAVGDPQCPSVGALTVHSRYSNDPCIDDTDCTEPAFCDTGLGICTTLTRLDSGWTGSSHGSDINGNSTTMANLLCPSPADPTCGECTVLGINPEPGNCRCSNDTRIVCDNPFSADTECGGATCNCYFGAPFPLSAGGTPVCVLSRFAENITGTANVDLGEGQVSVKLRSQVFLGIDGFQPCPYCAGRCSNDAGQDCLEDDDCGMGNTCQHDTPGDGVRDGICAGSNNTAEGGDSLGLGCDVMGLNANFPSIPLAGTRGGGYSLDCMPATGKNASGAGLSIDLSQTTGTTSLTAELPCTGGDCHCKVCSNATQTPCKSDGECSGGNCSAYNQFACSEDNDCASLNLGTCTIVNNTRCSLASSKTCATNADCQNQAGGTCNLATCSSNGAGIAPKPNDCTGGLCTDLGGGLGECTTGPDEHFCDGVTKANGDGILSCNPSNPMGSDADCLAVDPNAGDCTLSMRKKCFLDPIVATGVTDPEFPVGAAAFCVPPTGNGTINTVAGLPGPGRILNQSSSATFCASDTNVQYQPGVGGCPAP